MNIIVFKFVSKFMEKSNVTGIYELEKTTQNLIFLILY